MLVATRILLVGGVAMLAMTAGLASSHAQGQEQPQAPMQQQGGPVWDWREHAPQREPTRQREEELGIAPDRRESQNEAATVDSIYRELTGQGQGAGNSTETVGTESSR